VDSYVWFAESNRGLAVWHLKVLKEEEGEEEEEEKKETKK
jgi:hypothetical protein